MQNIESPKMLLNVKTAAEQLSVCQRTLWELTKREDIHVVRIGARVLFPVKELERFIAEHTAVETQAKETTKK